MRRYDPRSEPAPEWYKLSLQPRWQEPVRPRRLPEPPLFSPAPPAVEFVSRPYIFPASASPKRRCMAVNCGRHRTLSDKSEPLWHPWQYPLPPDQRVTVMFQICNLPYMYPPFLCLFSLDSIYSRCTDLYNTANQWSAINFHYSLFHISRKFRNTVKTDLQFRIGRNLIRHLSVVEFLVGNHIKISGSGQAEYNGFFFAGFPAFYRLINCGFLSHGCFPAPEEFLRPVQTFPAASKTSVCSTARASI